MLLSLGDPECLEPKRAGAKAARLAAARAAGLPTLPGVVVPAEASVPALEEAVAKVRSQGVHGTRLAIMDAEVGTLTDLCRAAGEMGDLLVVRSSSPVEDRAQWSGAFSSTLDVRPDEVLTAVRAVWASAVNEDALERREREDVDIASAGMAVLVQPEIQPDFSGTAEVDGTGGVTVVVVSGSPAPLMAGWDPGHRARCERDGTVSGDAARTLAGDPLLLHVAHQARAVRDRIGDNLVEWAVTTGGFWLLQCKTAVLQDAPAPPEWPREGGDLPGSAPRVARHLACYAGATGERLVLPWLLAGTAGSQAFPAGGAFRGACTDGALAAWDEASSLAATLTTETWQDADVPGDAAARTLAALRGEQAAGALRELAGLAAADDSRPSRILALLDHIAGELVRTGALMQKQHLWALAPDTVRALLEEDGKAPDASRAAHRAALRWEPFIHTAVMEHGERTSGQAASPGTGAGPAVFIEGKPERTALPPRAVIVAPRPLPHLAPLLWGASALVTVGGGVAAHLVEVARSLVIPAVVGCAKEELLSTAGTAALVAVDGSHGIVAVSRAPDAGPVSAAGRDREPTGG